MDFYLGVTDNRWFNYLSGISSEDVNFWKPGGRTVFRAIPPGSPFLFKLAAPSNAIGGMGFFSSYTSLPLNMAWEIFGERNGCATFAEFQSIIGAHRRDGARSNPVIGCIVLTNPLFFDRKDWVETPPDWHRETVQGKKYSTADHAGKRLWDQVFSRFLEYQDPLQPLEPGPNPGKENPDWPGYSGLSLSRRRIGQGAFRVLVTDAYNRKCSISGEKTLLVLEAAHIQSFSSAGPNSISNGLLLRSDIHKLFDAGYLTITPDYRVEVSRRIKQEFENGKEYYQFHGKTCLFLPEAPGERPRKQYIDWHNSNRYQG